MFAENTVSRKVDGSAIIIFTSTERHGDRDARRTEREALGLGRLCRPRKTLGAKASGAMLSQRGRGEPSGAGLDYGRPANDEVRTGKEVHEKHVDSAKSALHRKLLRCSLTSTLIHLYPYLYRRCSRSHNAALDHEESTGGLLDLSSQPGAEISDEFVALWLCIGASV